MREYGQGRLPCWLVKVLLIVLMDSVVVEIAINKEPSVPTLLRLWLYTFVSPVCLSRTPLLCVRVVVTCFNQLPPSIRLDLLISITVSLLFKL